MEYQVNFLYDGKLFYANFKSDYKEGSVTFLEALSIAMGEALKSLNEKPNKAKISRIELSNKVNYTWGNTREIPVDIVPGF